MKRKAQKGKEKEETGAFVSYVTTWFVIGILEVFDTKNNGNEDWSTFLGLLVFVSVVVVGASEFVLFLQFCGREMTKSLQKLVELIWRTTIITFIDSTMRSLCLQCLHDTAEDRTRWRGKNNS